MDIPVNFRTVDAGKCSDAVVKIILEGPLPLVTESNKCQECKLCCWKDMKPLRHLL